MSIKRREPYSFSLFVYPCSYRFMQANDLSFSCHLFLQSLERCQLKDGVAGKPGKLDSSGNIHSLSYFTESLILSGEG